MAVTLSVPGSSEACQMIRASGASASGSSAKVHPPEMRIRDRRIGGGRSACSRAGTDIPGDIAGIAPQPFPHQAGAIDAVQACVGPGVAPRFPVDHEPTKAPVLGISRNRSRMACLVEHKLPEYITNIVDSGLPPWQNRRRQKTILASLSGGGQSAVCCSAGWPSSNEGRASAGFPAA